MSNDDSAAAAAMTFGAAPSLDLSVMKSTVFCGSDQLDKTQASSERCKAALQRKW